MGMGIHPQGTSVQFLIRRNSLHFPVSVIDCGGVMLTRHAVDGERTAREHQYFLVNLITFLGIIVILPSTADLPVAIKFKRWAE